jgi:hypothetical protein
MRLRIKLWFYIFLLLACCLIFAAGKPAAGKGYTYAAHANATGIPELTIEPLHSYVKPGEFCTIQVFIDDAVDSLSCMEIYIAYDSILVECHTALEGELYEDASFPTFFAWDEVSADTVNAVDCVLGYRSYIIAPGELVKFVFKANAEGICMINMPSAKVWDIDRIPLETVLADRAFIHISVTCGDDTPVQSHNSLINIPNPFNPSTRIIFTLHENLNGPESTRALILIHDSSGRCIRRLFEGYLHSGNNTMYWDGRNDHGIEVATGIYYAVAFLNHSMFKRKLVLLR